MTTKTTGMATPPSPTRGPAPATQKLPPAGAFDRAGGDLLYFGSVGHGFGLDDHGDWDAVIVTRYPSARALADMWLDDDFVAAHANRRAGLARSQVLVSPG